MNFQTLIYKENGHFAHPDTQLGWLICIDSPFLFRGTIEDLKILYPELYSKLDFSKVEIKNVELEIK